MPNQKPDAPGTRHDAGGDAGTSRCPGTRHRARSTLPAARGTVLFLASEAVPFAKTGGLGDVVGALPVALGRIGWEATVALPRYRGVDAGALVEHFPVSVGGFTARHAFLRSAARGRRARRCSSTVPSCSIVTRTYGIGNTDYPDNARRFAVARARRARVRRPAVALPIIVHAHDWQAGLAPVYLQNAVRGAPGARRAPRRCSPFTTWRTRGCSSPTGCRASICRGICSRSIGLEFWGRISFLKGGINYADAVTTVSPTYAQRDPDAGVRIRIRRHSARRGRRCSSAS